MPTSTQTPPPQTRIGPHRWTCEEFHAMGDMGLFERRKMILVDGEILEMPMPNPPHDVALAKANDWLRKAFPTGHWVRPQMGLVLGINTDPGPDLAVVVGGYDDYAVHHPTTAVLVVEIAASSVAYDTGDKASLYAAAGIRDYWVVDLDGRRVFVFRDPQADTTQKYGHGYANVITYQPSESFTPLAAPTATVTAAELLP